jgi:protein LTV1
VQAELPIYWRMENLSAEQLSALDDETIARLKAREAHLRQEAAENERALDGDTSDEDEVAQLYMARGLRERFDCESALSLRSNACHHPGQIWDDPPRRVASAAVRPETIVLSSKTGLPADRRRAMAMAPPVLDGAHNLGAARVKSETSEEKRSRKAAVKESRRAARQSKKELKMAYTKEHQRAQKHVATNREANTSVMCLS